MYLIIRKNEKDFYYSECFGILKQDNEEKFIVFNSDYTNLILTDKNFYYRNSQESKNVYSTLKIFLLDADKSKWVKVNDNLQGYDFIVNNEAVMKKLQNKEQIDSSIISQAKEINEKFVVPEWFNVVTDDDIINFEQAAYHFDDAFLKVLIIEDTTITFVFDTTWDFLVHLRCDRASCEHNLKVEDHIMWFYADIDKTDNGFKFSSFEESRYGKRYGFIETNNMQWKIELLPIANIWDKIATFRELND